MTFMRLPVGKIERTLKVLPGCADILFGGAVMLVTRVLLVGGDEVVRMTLAGVLEQPGFAITSAANAREFLRPARGEESSDVAAKRPAHAKTGSGDALTVVGSSASRKSWRS